MTSSGKTSAARIARPAVSGVAVALVALAVSVPTLVAAPLTKGIHTGVIVVGRGAAGVRLGMTRAQVVARLGRPFNENSNGFMDYSGRGSPGLFDLYLTAGRVTLIVVDGAPHQGWRLADGNHIFDSGGFARLRHRYGSRLKLTRLDHVEWVYRIASRLNGRTVWTDFSVWPLNSKGKVTGADLLLR